MTVTQIKIQMLKKGLTVKTIAEELGTRREMISQLINGHYYYPRYAREMRERWGIIIPDDRPVRRARKQAA